MERFCLCAELTHEAARAAGGHGNGVCCFINAEPHDACASGRSAYGAHRCGRMPAPIAVEWIDRLSHPTHDLQTDNITIDHVGQTGILLLGYGEQCRDQDGAGMGFGGIKIIVKIERVSTGAIVKRGPWC